MRTVLQLSLASRGDASRHGQRCCKQKLSVINGAIELQPRPHQQQCRNNIVECYKSNDSFDKVECCFDITAVLGNNVERNFILSTKSKQIEHVHFFRLCRKDEILRQTRSTLLLFLAKKSNVASTKWNVASTLLLVWTGLKLTTLVAVTMSCMATETAGQAAKLRVQPGFQREVGLLYFCRYMNSLLTDCIR